MAGRFYGRLRESRKDDDPLAACIDRVAKQLEDTSTTGDRPGMLLGKIQSGKTCAFVGVIARTFDRGFDMAVVFTKGTKGTKELGWSGHQFWWPILAAPGTVEPCVFATKVAAD